MHVTGTGTVPVLPISTVVVHSHRKYNENVLFKQEMCHSEILAQFSICARDELAVAVKVWRNPQRSLHHCRWRTSLFRSCEEGRNLGL